LKNTFAFHIGNIPCWTVSDGITAFAVERFFANAPADQLSQALKQHPVVDSRIPTHLNCLLMYIDGSYVLVDTGMGGSRPGTGQLIASIRSLGLTSESIRYVVLSHTHGDHMGGIASFPEAQVILSAVEWEVCTEAVRQEVKPATRSLRLVTDGELILPGLTAVAAPGHSAGQIGVLLESASSSLHYTADVVAHMLHVSQPGWYIAADSDPEQAIRTRHSLLEAAAQTRRQLFGYHLPFPGLYQITRTANGFGAVLTKPPSSE